MPAIKLRKIGGSTVVSIPPHVLEALALKAGSEVTVDVERGRAIMSPAKGTKPTLAELLAQCDLSKPNTPAEQAEIDLWENLKPVGREVI